MAAKYKVMDIFYSQALEQTQFGIPRASRKHKEVCGIKSEL